MENIVTSLCTLVDVKAKVLHVLATIIGVWTIVLYLLTELWVVQAWTLWNEGNALRLADPTFCNDFRVEEMTKCIHIGLLCIQEEAAKRPRMASVVYALNGESIALPLPSLPVFLTGSTNSGVEESSDHYTHTSDRSAFMKV